MAAGSQGKFWEFHDELYKNYNQLNDQKINEIAKMLQLDETKFGDQQHNPAIIDHIRKDYEEGIQLGIRGIPTVFINGKKIRDRSMKNLEAEIDRELEKSKKRKLNAD